MNGASALKQAKNYVDKSLQGIGALKGQKGDPGRDGITPHIDPTTKHWFIDSKDTGIVAEGKDGVKGLQGIPGDTPYIGENGNWWYGNTDSGIPIPSIEDLLQYVDKVDGIQDTPIGHILSYMGNSTPKHYLICDGNIYNINDYPYLAQHFADNFGKANYFGGDGIATFAVPDLRGEFLRGTGANAHYKQGAGSGVGGHQDATQIQNIFMEASNKRVYAFGASGYASGTVINQDSVIATRAGQGSYNADAQNGNASAQISIYTPRPTNTSVLYCIKCEPTYYIDATGDENSGENALDDIMRIQGIL